MMSMRPLYSAAALLGADLVEAVRKCLKDIGANVVVSRCIRLPTCVQALHERGKGEVGHGRVMPRGML